MMRDPTTQVTSKKNNSCERPTKKNLLLQHWTTGATLVVQNEALRKPQHQQAW